MVDIQSASAAIRRGKKKRLIEEEDKRNHGKDIMAYPLLWAAVIICGSQHIDTLVNTCDYTSCRTETLSCSWSL